MKEAREKHEEMKSYLGLRIKTGRSTDGSNQTNVPCTMLDLPSPSSEEEILEALKETTPLMTPKIGEMQEKWNRELFMKIVGVARFVNKMKALKSNYSVTFCTPDDDLTTPIAQRTGSGVVITKVPQLEVKELETVKAFAANGDASKSKEVALNGQSREPSEEFVYGGEVVSPRKYAPENPSSKIQEPQSAYLPPRKKTILSLDLNNSISTNEQRKLVRKWNYVKAIIEDIQHTLRENTDSITTATILEENSEELKQILQGIEVSISGLVPMLKELANEIRNQNLDIETVKREKVSSLTNELNSLNESYEQYKEIAKQYKRELEMHESKLERVIRRRQLHDIKILDQLDKIEKIKFELAEAEEELEKLERNRYDFLEEEDELKEQSNATKLELGDVMKRIDVSKDNVHRVNFQIENLDEAIDLEFDTRNKEIHNLVEILLNLEVL
ncbi:hypothetical protein FCM35_KLT09635 [Carex littledalei]|uniref:Uncharacterized protein n=1 Tax=Carex littledalei TaxID=544730 RepID=A0A833RRY6_9POAL|nr:hypothetical protein FCM35_KLT09635 [Carex littledalei]